MRKKLSILLGAALLAGAMSGCGSTGAAKPVDADKGSSQEAVRTQESQTETKSEEETVVVKLGLAPLAEDAPEVWDKYNKDLETFAKDHPDVTIENARYDYGTDTFVPLAESGNLPTIYNTWFSEPQKLISNGYAADITDILEERGWLDVMNKSILGILSDKDGRVYGVPAQGYALGLMQNVNLFKEAGLVDEAGIPLRPANWEEVAQYAQIIKEKTGVPGLCILAQDNGAGWHFTNIAWGYGAEFSKKNDDGTYTANVNSPEAIEAMEFVKALKWEYDVLTDDPLSENGGTGIAHIAAGTAAMVIGANDATSALVDNGAELGDFALCAFPAGPKGQYSLFGGTPYMFSPDATEAEINAALDFMTLYNGIGPNASEEELDSIAKRNIQQGYPVMPSFKLWDSPELNAVIDRVIEKNSNMDSALYQDYFDTIVKDGNLHLEEPAATQDLYAELTKVLQAVLTDKDADVASLMETANNNYQIILDGLN